MQRRDFLKTTAFAPAILRAQALPEGAATQIGDVMPGRAIVWARMPRAGRLVVRYRGEGGSWKTVRGPELTAATSFTGRVDLSGLAAGQRVVYHAQLEEGKSLSEPLSGHFLTPPAGAADVRFLWSGDMVGQGYGINPDLGGIRIFDVMRRLDPHFFLHSGDTIYADSPVPAEVAIPNEKPWRNVTTEAKSKVAETLDEFRGCYQYNLLDTHVRRFSAEVAQVWQWDDHEFTNNWSPSKDLTADNRYREKNIQTLLRRARQAFLEYAPLRIDGGEAERIYRRIPYGPLLDVFVIDMRSYRGPNTFNRQTQESAETQFLGRPQLAWLERDLAASRALWKVIAADMPLGLEVGDGKDEQGRARWEAVANGPGPALGRELEFARLLRGVKQRRVRNTVWLTADVHYTAAHYYDPAQAQFTDFLPFWEFVSGPLNAGSFGPGKLDNTFGPRVEFQKAPPRQNMAPSAGYQFFGDVRIDGSTRALSVTLRDATGAGLYTKTLAPEVS